MECPKCGSVQDESREDCESCGVVFERWRTAQERAQLLAHTRQSQPVVHSAPGVPGWMIVLAMAVVIGLGTMWTMKRREARARATVAPEVQAKVEFINEKLKLARAVAAAASQRGSQTDAMSLAIQQGPVSWPQGLSQTSAKELIERCHAFVSPLDIALPKSFPRHVRAEAMELGPLSYLLRRGLVQLDESSDPISVQVTPAGWAVPIVDNGETYMLAMGRPRVSSVTQVSSTPDSTSVAFTWNYEKRDGRDLVSGRENFVGEVVLTRDGSSWRAVDGTIGRGELKAPACN